MAISVINNEDLMEVSGGSPYEMSVGVAVGFLTVGLTVTAPVWGTALLLGSSIAASGAAIYYAW